VADTAPPATAPVGAFLAISAYVDFGGVTELLLIESHAALVSTTATTFSSTTLLLLSTDVAASHASSAPALLELANLSLAVSS